MRSKDEFLALAKAIKRAPRDIKTLLGLSGLNSATDFRNLDLRNFDFSHCDLTGLNFTGSAIDGCRFTGARVFGAVFDVTHSRHSTLFADAWDRPSFPVRSKTIVVGGDSHTDFIPLGSSSSDFRPHVAGTALHCAVALAKLGNPTRFLGPISNDGYGDTFIETFSEAGVKTLMKQRVDVPTTKVFVHADKRGNARYELTLGADQAVDREALISALPGKMALLYLSGMVLNDPGVARAWLGVAQEATSRGATLAVDLEVRPALISDMTAYRRRITELVEVANIIKLSEEDLPALEPQLRPEEYAQRLLQQPGCELVVITLGEDGALAFTRMAMAKASIFRPKMFGDAVGAGSAFMAGMITALAERHSLKAAQISELSSSALSEVLQMASVVAGLTCGKIGFEPPTRKEVDAAISASGA